MAFAKYSYNFVHLAAVAYDNLEKLMSSVVQPSREQHGVFVLRKTIALMQVLTLWSVKTAFC